MNRIGASMWVNMRLAGLLISAMGVWATTGCASHAPQVRQYGRMHDVLSKGAAGATARVALADELGEADACGVGALAGLDGEITIVDGKAWIARPTAGGLRVDGPETSSTEKAALLTVARVPAWTDVRIDEGLGGETLEKFIAKAARSEGLGEKGPLPFVIEGEATDLQTHVINGECPMRPGVRLTADHQPWRFQSSSPVKVTLVGFYAADSVGNLTHPGTAIHAHAIFDADGKTVTAHVERVELNPGATLRLPAWK
ncbi:MAG: acetolactate decarboxylase [Phycisphaerae bacterium]|nr:acetolactate decarboxylase [Phycisphaerae bacterium]